MKTDQPIRVDARRRKRARRVGAGRRWTRWSGVASWSWRRRTPDARPPPWSSGSEELRRLGGGDWSDFAVLARTRAVLEPIRALCEAAGIPVAWREDLPPLHRVREVAALLDRLRALGRETLSATELLDLAA